MTREEAAAVLDAIIFGVYPDDDITINKIGIEAVRFAITALRGPQPDPFTGLMPCGCGGRAKQEDFFDGFFYFGAIKCPGCEIEIRIPSLTPEESSDRVKVAWNTAMGWREDK